MSNRFAGMLASLVLLSGCSAPEQEPIILAGIPLDDSQDVAASYANLADLLSEALDREVEFFQAPDYASITEAVLSGQVDIAQLSAFSYVLASGSSDGLEILGASGRNPTDPPGYVSYAIKRAGDNEITNLSDLRGKTICFSDPSSGAGYLWPAKYLAELGIDPSPLESKDINFVFAETFPQVALSVQTGDCDAGFMLDVFFDKTLTTSDSVDLSLLEKFWESNVSPGIPLVANVSSFSDSELNVLKKVVRERANKDYLVSAGVCDDRANCNHLTAAAWGYVEVQDDFYDEIRELCRLLDLQQCKE
jgi:phosphonate transport system substrate-binding protein